MIAATAAYLIEICERADAESSLPLLSPAELILYRALKTSKRRLDWLSGRAAAKRALGRYFETEGSPVPAAEIEIFNDDAGRPFCRARGRVPAFSISHTDLGGLCAVSPSGRIGADWEMVASRDKGVLDLAFHEAERTPGLLSSPSEQTTLWTLKEAVLKFLGTGLLCSPKNVFFIDGSLRLEGRAFETWASLGKPAVKTESFSRGASMISLAYC